MQIKKVNDEVLYADETIVNVDYQDIAFLKKNVQHNERKRIRLCTHQDVHDQLHEMLIVLSQDTYIRPHKHQNKSESFHIIEGIIEVVVFDELGKVLKVIPMGDYTSGRKFYYRLAEPSYHTVLIRTDMAVFHETTNGPFNQNDTDFATWAPNEHDKVAAQQFKEQLIQRINNS
jgi:cupin fold WbuC family metalloprotein